jgi:hypothetical protein
MNGRSSRLQLFLVRFDELKAAAVNDPKLLCSFVQTTAEIRAAARLMRDYLVGSEVEVEMFRGADKLIAHAPEGIEHSWNDFRQRWEPGIDLTFHVTPIPYLIFHALQVYQSAFAAVYRRLDRDTLLNQSDHLAPNAMPCRDA